MTNEIEKCKEDIIQKDEANELLLKKIDEFTKVLKDSSCMTDTPKYNSVEVQCILEDEESRQ